jgi:hypothetical protein
VLVSHDHKFIYLKTIKTAGTSVEAALEPFCTPPGHVVSERTSAIVSPHGIVGSRGDDAGGEYYHHMTAAQVKAKVGDTVWDQYYKICNVRNPFDKVVSQFWFLLDPEEKERLYEAGFDAAREAFVAWVGEETSLGNDAPMFSIGNVRVVDAIIRYESIEADLKKVLDTLGLPMVELARLKGNRRAHRDRPFQDYYDQKTADIVVRKFKIHFDTLGYREDSWAA